jgi:signal transduction histidine kinase
VNSFRPSLRRSIVAALAMTFILGYFVITAVVNIVLDVRDAGSIQGNACIGSRVSVFYSNEVCGGSYGTATDVLLLAAAGVGLVLVVWGWWLLSARVLRPLAVTADTVRQLGPQNLGQRIRLSGSADPLKELADALDNALDRLAAGYESQRRFAANASHELRTPLAVQRLLTEVAMDAPQASQDLHQLGAQLLRTNERNENLIEGLLILTESDRGLVGKVPVRLDEVAGSALDAHRELADQQGVSLRQSLGQRLVPGDRLLLEQMVGNLVKNAITYNHPGGWVEIVVAGEPALTVRNTGPNVPAEAVPALFEPFRRLGADRTSHDRGAGLGLSIVRSVTTAHSGTIQARPRPEGGLIIEIDLPGNP